MGQLISFLKKNQEVLETPPDPISEVPVIHLENKSLSFPFFDDEPTIEFFRDSKIMLILRGVPGSGKTFLAHKLQSKYSDITICSAHDFLPQENGMLRRHDYGKAYQECKRKAQDACERGCRLVVVDNVNDLPWHINPYHHMAVRSGYIPLVVEPQTEWKLDPTECYLRCQHRCSLPDLQQQCGDWKPLHPLYTGWFLNDCDSHNLVTLTSAILEQCLRFPEFSFFFEKYLLQHECSDIQEYFGLWKKLQTSGLLHCTTRFLGRSGQVQTEEEAAKYGEATWLHLVGLCVSPRTVCLQVWLTPEQQQIWSPSKATLNSSESLSSVEQDGYPFQPLGLPPGRTGQDLAANIPWPVEKASLPTFHVCPPDLEPLEVANFPLSSHLTVGTAHNVQPVQSGPDLHAALTTPTPSSLERFLPGGSLMVRRGDTWLVSFHRPFRVAALYASFLT